MNEHTREHELDAFFATLTTQRELELPMADFECSGCGQIDRHDAGCPNTDSMEVALMDAVRTTACKVDDCPNEAPRFGRYAGLCPEHRNGEPVASDYAIALANGDAPYPDQFGTDRVNDDGPANESVAVAVDDSAIAEDHTGDESSRAEEHDRLTFGYRQMDHHDSDLVAAARDVDAALVALAIAKGRLLRLVDEVN